MVVIDYKEVKYLQDKGFKFGESIYKSHSRKPTYYCNEGKALKVLNAYRESRILETRN